MLSRCSASYSLLLRTSGLVGDEAIAADRGKLEADRNWLSERRQQLAQDEARVRAAQEQERKLRAEIDRLRGRRLVNAGGNGLVQEVNLESYREAEPGSGHASAPRSSR